jgi:hypothetical protein
LVSGINNKNISSIEAAPLNINELLSNPYFLKLKNYGLIDEIALRNLIIKYEYRILRNDLPLGEAIYRLSQKYSRSESAINTILFRIRTRKPIPFPNIKSIPLK